MKFKISRENINEKFIIYLMMLTPFIDLLNGLFEYIFKINISPGVVIRSGILVIIIYIYIMQKRSNILKIIGIVALFLVQILFLSFNNDINIYAEISFISKIYYNIFLIFIIGRLFRESNIDYEVYVDKFISVSLIITISLIITKVLGIGISAYGDAGGYKGLYMGLNDLTAVLVITFPFILYRLSTANNKIKYSIYATFVGVNIVSVGTKTSLVILTVIIMFFVYQIMFKQRKFINIIVVLISIVVFFIVFEKYFWETYSSTILVRQKYFMENQNFITFLVSGRNATLITAMEHWNSGLFNILFGLGFTKGSEFIGSFLLGHGMIEMDFFDILYFYGLIFLLIVAIPLVNIFLKSIKNIFKAKKLLYKIICLVYILVIIISFLGGHVLLSPLAGIYFAVIYGLVGGMKLEKENI